MTITFIGGGNMASAMIGGLLRSGYHAGQLRVVEVDADRARVLRTTHRIDVHTALGDWIADSELAVLAVKPQQAHEACDALRPVLGATAVLSIAAGVRAATLARWLASSNIVRAMPNTPALIGRGVSAAVALPAVSAGARATVERVLRAIGAVLWLDDERLLDPVTAVSGSGPAYVFYFIEAIERAARELGLSSADARELTLQTFVGAAQLAAGSDEPAAVLRERVTSKGGTTAAALATLDAAGVAAAIVAAVHAANARAGELGDELDR